MNVASGSRYADLIPTYLSPIKSYPPLEIKISSPVSSKARLEEKKRRSSPSYDEPASTTILHIKRARTVGTNRTSASITVSHQTRKPASSPRRSPFGPPVRTLKRAHGNQTGEPFSPYAALLSRKRAKLGAETPPRPSQGSGLPPILPPHLDLTRPPPPRSPQRPRSPSKALDIKLLEPERPRKKLGRLFGVGLESSDNVEEAAEPKLPALALFSTGDPSPLKPSAAFVKPSPSKFKRVPPSTIPTSASSFTLNDPEPDVIDSPSKFRRKGAAVPKKSMLPRRIPSTGLLKPSLGASTSHRQDVSSVQPIQAPLPHVSERDVPEVEIPPRPHTSLDVSRPFKRRTTLTPDTQASLSNLSLALEKLNIPRAKPRHSLAQPSTSSSASTSHALLPTHASLARSVSTTNARPSHGRDTHPSRPGTALGLSSSRGFAHSRVRQSFSGSASTANRRASLASQALSKTLSESQGPGASDVAQASGGGGLQKPSQGLKSSTANTQQVAKLRVLAGCVIFVDVRTEEGDDASALFVDMLRSLGARILSRPSPSLTHIVFKSGHLSTLSKYRAYADPKPFLVGIGWVVECVERRSRVPEAAFAVGDATEWSRGGQKARQMNIITMNQIKGTTGGGATVQGNSNRAKLNIREALRSSISAAV